MTSPYVWCFWTIFQYIPQLFHIATLHFLRPGRRPRASCGGLVQQRGGDLSSELSQYAGHIHARIWVCQYIHVYIQCVYIYICVLNNMYISVYVYKYIYVCIYIYTYIYIHIHTYVYACSLMKNFIDPEHLRPSDFPRALLFSLQANCRRNMGDLTGAIKACEEGLSHYTTFCSQLVTAVARSDEPLTFRPKKRGHEIRPEIRKKLANHLAEAKKGPKAPLGSPGDPWLLWINMD